MRKSLIFTALVSIVILAVGVTAQTVRAQRVLDSLTLVVIDRSSITSGDMNDQLVNTFLGLLADLKDGEPIAFAFADNEAKIYGPVESNAAGFAKLQSEVRAAVGSGSASEPVNLASCLSSIYEYMSSARVRKGADVYLVSASPEYAVSDETSTDIDAALAPIIERGWRVYTVTTPGASDALASALDGISLDTRGESFSLSIPDGIEDFVDRSLRMESRGALTAISQADMSVNPVFEVDLDIVPSTRWANIMFVREDPETSFRITNPSGEESSMGDRASSSVIELPNLVIWRVTEPVQGNWKAEVRGDSGVVSANLHTINRYTVELQYLGAVPIDHPETLIVAAVLDKGELVSPDATVTAKITDPSGDSIVHELNDAGLEGDSIPQDGHFSLTIPPVKSEGRYDVELRLSWPDVEHSIISQAEFEAQHFPTIEVREETVAGLEPGVTEKIASLFVNIKGQPYTVPKDELLISVSGSDDTQAGEVTVIPHEIVTLGKAYGYDVYYRPPSESRATVLFGLNTEYAGRHYIYSTDATVVSSVPAPPAPPAQVSVPAKAEESQPAPAVAPPPQPAPTAVPPQVEPPADEGSGIPIQAVIIALAVIAIAILGVALYWLTRPTPFGYLYSEEGELLVDFPIIRRAPMDSLMKRSRIDGEELDLPGFGGVSFVFESDTITMVSTEVLPNTVRVNNQPVTDTMPIHDDSVIGASGRLYFFRYIPETETDGSPEAGIVAESSE